MAASPTYGVPVAPFTLVAAFFPIVGAILAGLLAAAVALAVAGPLAALAVAAVALVVQQLDNDLLAPVIYGHMTRMHPLSILIASVALLTPRCVGQLDEVSRRPVEWSDGWRPGGPPPDDGAETVPPGNRELRGGGNHRSSRRRDGAFIRCSPDETVDALASSCPGLCRGNKKLGR